MTFFFANPKSPIFTTPLLNMTLAGFRSLNNLKATCELYLLWPETWNHCKFVWEYQWLLLQKGWDCDQYIFKDHRRRFLGLCNSYESFPSRRGHELCFLIWVIAEFEFTRRERSWDNRLGQLYRGHIYWVFFIRPSQRTPSWCHPAVPWKPKIRSALRYHMNPFQGFLWGR